MSLLPGSYPNLIGDMGPFENTGSGHCSDAGPRGFIIILTSIFLKPCVFAVVLACFGLAMAQWIAIGSADSFKANKNRDPNI